MSASADEMLNRLRRVPVGQPAAQQLALPPPAAPVVQPGTAPVTQVPASGNTVMVDQAGRASVSNVQPRVAPTAGTGMADFGGQASRAARAANAATALPGGATLAPGSTIYVGTDGTARAGAQLGAAGQRARAAAQGITAAQTLAAPPAAAAAEGAAVRGVAGAVPKAAGALPKAAGPLAVGLEALNVVGAAREGGVENIARQVGVSGSRLAGARIGATIGQKFGGGYGAAAGGAAGYLAGDAIADTQFGRDAAMEGMQAERVYNDLNPVYNPKTNTVSTSDGRMFGSGRLESDPFQQVAGFAKEQGKQARASRAPLVNPTVDELELLGTIRRPGDVSAAPGAAGAALAGRPDFSGVTSSVDSTAQQVGGGGTGGRGRAIGTFTGSRTGTRTIYEGEDVARSPNAGGTFNVVPSTAFTGTAAQTLGTGPAQQQRRGGGTGAVGAVIGSGDDTVKRIERMISDLGPLDRRGRRQAATDLLGLRSRIEQGGLDRESADTRSSAELAQRSAASQLSADVDREQIAATTANARRQNTQTLTGADGTVYSVNGTSVAPLTTNDGQPFRAGTKADDSTQKLAADLLKSSLESGLVTDPNAAAQQAASAARALQQATNTPPGMTYIGTQNGRPVYQDAKGQRFVDE